MRVRDFLHDFGDFKDFFQRFKLLKSLRFSDSDIFFETFVTCFEIFKIIEIFFSYFQDFPEIFFKSRDKDFFDLYTLRHALQSSF